MKNIKVTTMKFYCKSCKKLMEGGRNYLTNSYCGDRSCLDVRREESNSIDLRDNSETTVYDNGFASVKPVDPTKLWKASKENKKIIADRRKKYYEENSD